MLGSIATLAPPINTPTIVWSNGSATGMTSPVEYRPAVCGTGTKTDDWNGKSDPNFRFHSGLFETKNGGANDLALYGELKPGGAAQAAAWPVIVEFNTSAAVNQMEVVFWGPTTPPSMRLEVNGLPVIGDFVIQGPAGFGNGRKALLTFPDARSSHPDLRLWRRRLLWRPRTDRGSISKPTDTIRTGAIIGDSFVNGSGGATSTRLALACSTPTRYEF